MEHEKLRVTCHNEDDGNVSEIEADPEDYVAMVIAAMYEKFHLEPRDGDRLRCDATGDNVFAHSEKKLEAYKATYCRELVWLFSSDQGGALR